MPGLVRGLGDTSVPQYTGRLGLERLAEGWRTAGPLPNRGPLGLSGRSRPCRRSSARSVAGTADSYSRPPAMQPQRALAGAMGGKPARAVVTLTVAILG